MIIWQSPGQYRSMAFEQEELWETANERILCHEKLEGDVAIQNEEWNTIKDETGPPEVPFSDQTRKNLPCEIQQKVITFGGDWFKPAEASGLGKKIRMTLKNEFSKAKGMFENVDRRALKLPF